MGKIIEEGKVEIFIAIMEVFWAMLCAIGDMIIALMPAVLELNKIRNYCTPVGFVAVYIGVPTVVVTIAIALIKKAFSRQTK